MRDKGDSLKKTVFIISIIIVSLAVILLIGIALIYARIDFRADEELFESSRQWSSTTFYADEEESEGYQPVEIEISGEIRKIHSSLDEISPYIKRGFIAVEDKIFYEHSGVDIKRTAMAAANYILRREKVFGASTITQQVIKNISGDNQPKITRKLSEIIRARHIEKKYSKDEILELYLNVIPMSEGIFGVSAASKAYFGKEATDLTPAEAATLIGITNAPTAYNPYLHPEQCKNKRNIILRVMLTDGIISESEYTKAVNSPLEVIPREEREDRLDSWFVETVIDEVVSDLASQNNISSSAARIKLLGGGYKVFTTMNPRVQSKLEAYFENEENLPAEIKNGLNYAMVVTDAKSGDLVGIIGRAGKKSGNRLLNHALTPHMPASALKPLALYAPLIEEKKINWATVFDDVPVSFYEQEEGLREYPQNSPTVYDGLLPVKDALRLSKNTVAMRLCSLRGERKIFQSLRDEYGWDSLIEKEGGLTDIAVAPMAFGQMCKGVSLLKLTEGYSVFNGDGVRSKARSYIAVADYNGNIVLENNSERNRILSESTARIMNQLLMTVTDNGTAKGIKLKDTVQTAGKTGTSSGSRDKIFVGYTPYFTAGIWCGYDDGAQPVVSLSKSHLEIWDEIMTHIHSDIGDKEPKQFSTEGLLYLPYCRDSGERYAENCIYDPRGNRRDFGYFTPDNQPTSACTRHVVCMYDSITKGIADESCPKANLVPVSLIFIESRAFPKEIYVTDAEFVYRNTSGYSKRPLNSDLPYFWNEIPDGEYVGISKSKKQFNSSCHGHK